MKTPSLFGLIAIGLYTYWVGIPITLMFVVIYFSIKERDHD